MELQPRFTFILQQGKAKKSFFEMTDEEQEEAARRIFEKITIEAAKVGQSPVVRRYPNSVTKND
ncbi:MAG TPA: hypothetical protein VFE50_24565 [Cyclobacteriaceae bacterium]|nr:hypothetical protein [Cyclobacteriaceae bacterium]